MNSLIKKIGTYFFIVFFTVFVFLIILEVINYMSVAKITGYFVWEPGLKKVFFPDPSSFHGIYNDSHFTINSLGYRGPLIADKSKEYRILAIGGSTTECLYLDDSETWAYLLMNNLIRTNDNKKVITMNIGKSGHGLRNNLLELKYLPENYEPDLVIMMVGVNDVLFKLSRGDSWKPFNESEFNNSESYTFTLYPGYTWKSTISYKIYRYLDLMSKKIKPQDTFGNTLTENRLNRKNAKKWINNKIDLDAALDDYEKNLKRVINLSKEKNITLIFSTQPYIWKKNMTEEENSSLWMTYDFNDNYYPVETMIFSMNAFNNRLLEVCMDNKDIHCIDLEKSVPKTLDYFYDDMHFNEGGASFVAEKLSLYIKENFKEFSSSQ